MSHSDWTVDGALGEVIAAIQSGAQPLELESGTCTTLEALYRRDFEARWNDGADWTSERDDVLPLAKWVGVLATGLTLGRIASSGSLPNSWPIPVDESAAVAAAKLVAAVHCREKKAQGGVVILRRWCKSVGDGSASLPVAPNDPLTALIDILRRRAGS